MDFGEAWYGYKVLWSPSVVFQLDLSTDGSRAGKISWYIVLLLPDYIATVTN